MRRGQIRGKSGDESRQAQLGDVAARCTAYNMIPVDVVAGAPLPYNDGILTSTTHKSCDSPRTARAVTPSRYHQGEASKGAVTLSPSRPPGHCIRLM